MSAIITIKKQAPFIDAIKHCVVAESDSTFTITSLFKSYAKWVVCSATIDVAEYDPKYIEYLANEVFCYKEDITPAIAAQLIFVDEIWGEIESMWTNEAHALTRYDTITAARVPA